MLFRSFSSNEMGGISQKVSTMSPRAGDVEGPDSAFGSGRSSVPMLFSFLCIIEVIPNCQFIQPYAERASWYSRMSQFFTIRYTASTINPTTQSYNSKPCGTEVPHGSYCKTIGKRQTITCGLSSRPCSWHPYESCACCRPRNSSSNSSSSVSSSDQRS